MARSAVPVLLEQDLLDLGVGDDGQVRPRSSTGSRNASYVEDRLPVAGGGLEQRRDTRSGRRGRGRCSPPSGSRPPRQPATNCSAATVRGERTDTAERATGAVDVVVDDDALRRVRRRQVLALGEVRQDVVVRPALGAVRLPSRRSRRGGRARRPCSSGWRTRRASCRAAPSSGRRSVPCRRHPGRRCTSSRPRGRAAATRPRRASPRAAGGVPPASTSATRTEGSSVSRAAMTAPAEPPPTTMTSKRSAAWLRRSSTPPLWSSRTRPARRLMSTTAPAPGDRLRSPERVRAPSARVRGARWSPRTRPRRR